MNLFLTLLNLPPQTLMSWNGLRPFPTMLGVSGLARPNVPLCAPCGALPNIIGWGFTIVHKLKSDLHLNGKKTSSLIQV